MESITKGQAFGDAFPLQKKNIFFSFYLTKAEMLALSMQDIDLENCQIHITKTYYRMNRTDIITEPKTDNSVRTIEIPVFLANEIQFYWKHLYQYQKNERLFPVVAEAVQHTMKRHIDKAGVTNGFGGVADSLTTYYYSYSDRDCDMAKNIEMLEKAKEQKG